MPGGIAVASAPIMTKTEAVVDKPEKNLLFSFTLNGVMEGPGESLAIIDNKILKKGDYIHGAQLINISTDRVTLLYDDKEIILYIE